MLLSLRLPRIHELMDSAAIEAVHVRAGVELPVGAKLADITVDLSAIAAQDCPPVSHYRIVLRERLWLRELRMARGDDVAVGSTLALFTTDPAEATAAEPQREARIAIAGILSQPEWTVSSA
ncbi:MAG: hypothetical protein ABI585_13605 [Betaproteobacteria bacterium]